MLSLETVRQQLTQILHLQESPHRTALAFSIGVFIAFSPHYGFHIASVVFCAWAFRLNYLALFLGAFINNPWTFAPILGLALYIGITIFGSSAPPDFDMSQIQLDTIFQSLAPYLIPFILGSFVLGILGAIAAYPLMLLAIHRYRSAKEPSKTA